MVEAEAEQARSAERLIAGARVALAVSALTALWLDPSEPPRFATLTFRLVLFYFGCGVAILVWAWVARNLPRWFGPTTHALDLAMFGGLVSLTRGPSSPFFVFFILALVAAALRWQWPGTLWTGAAALATLLGDGLWMRLAPTLGDGTPELNRLIVRSGYLLVVVVLLGYLGDHGKKLNEQVSRMSALEERMRFARDLHDGTIQSLTGAALRLSTLPSLMETDRPAALRTVAEVGDLLREEQKSLREFVERTREGGDPVCQSLMARLPKLAARIERDWGLHVDWTVRSGLILGSRLLEEIPKLLSEALVNSARHGEATCARLNIAVRKGRVTLVVSDDGHGFPFQGRYRADQLLDRGLGPQSLMQRVASLGGELTIDSTQHGARLEITLPMTVGRS